MSDGRLHAAHPPQPIAVRLPVHASMSVNIFLPVKTWRGYVMVSSALLPSSAEEKMRIYPDDAAFAASAAVASSLDLTFSDSFLDLLPPAAHSPSTAAPFTSPANPHWSQSSCAFESELDSTLYPDIVRWGPAKLGMTEFTHVPEFYTDFCAPKHAPEPSPNHLHQTIPYEVTQNSYQHTAFPPACAMKARPVNHDKNIALGRRPFVQLIIQHTTTSWRGSAKG